MRVANKIKKNLRDACFIAHFGVSEFIMNRFGLITVSWSVIVFNMDSRPLIYPTIYHNCASCEFCVLNIAR